ncbi:aminotransferase class I/II-fold pyridoxal phosphate-dependent enzyme [bacterium]|nr:aminotransferase class I/II-fold pyridoxal phosphate-dependent enzyme [bacterium]
MIKPKKQVQKLTAYSIPLDIKECTLKLDSNENLHGPSPRVLEALRKLGKKEISLYPAYGKLREKIAEFNRFELENIKVTDGADEAISGIIQAYLGEGDVMLTLKPSFVMPVMYAKVAGAEVVEVDYENNFTFPLDTFSCHLNDIRVKVIYLASPNNPTGTVLSPENLAKILTKAKNKVVIIDETYANYYGESFKGVVRKFDNIFIVRSFSKDFALAGLRLGYVISAKQNIEVLDKVISPYSVNIAAVKAGLAALEDFKYFIDIKNEVTRAKNKLTKLFTSLGCKVYPSGANFLLINCGQKFDYLMELFSRQNISVKTFEGNTKLKNHIRLTVPPESKVPLIEDTVKLRHTIVFDMDGVLIDATESYRKTISDTFEYFTGVKVSNEKIQEIKNMGGYNNDWDLTEYLLRSVDSKIDKKQIVEQFQKTYWDDGKGLINNETLLVDKKILDKLNKKYNMFIFTGRLREEAEYTLEKLGIREYFLDIVTTSDIPEGKGKPDPYGLDLIKKKILFDKIFYFGDTLDDLQCAEKADVIPIGVLPPLDKKDDLKNKMYEKGAVMVVDSLNDVGKVLEI